MSQLLTFPEDTLCPMDCHGSGGFVKAKALKQKEVNEHSNVNGKLIELDNEKPAAQKPIHKDEIDKQEIKEDLSHTCPIMNIKIDSSKVAEQLRTKPIVSKYSIHRYSLDDWRKHNDKMLDSSVIAESNVLNYNIQTAIGAAFGNMDQEQHQDNTLLKQKAKDLFRWKVEVEHLCKEMAKEVNLLEIDRQRIKRASKALMLPKSISKECIELRSNRAETELVADLAEQELKKEMELVKEVRASLKSTLQRIEEQLAVDKAAKHKIEYDWSDKTVAYGTESRNLSLNSYSNTLMFKPGAVKYAENTAPLSYWEYYCRDSVKNVEAVRQASEDLRGSLNAILINNGKKLRKQADETDKALAETIAQTSEIVTKLEERLRYTLRSIADIETLIKNLHEAILKCDRAMKLAQTRLDNRNIGRPHVENVRDQPHTGLLHDVKVIHNTVTSLLMQLKNAEKTSSNLMAKRVELEKDIAAKRKSLNIDRERCGMIRSHYPSASELAGL